MKKLLSILLVMLLMVPAVSITVSADAVDVYYSQSFDDISDLTGIAKLTSEEGSMRLSLADAKDEGISAQSNQVLKIDISAATAKEDNNVEFALQSGNEQIAVNQRLQFQVDFYKTDAKSTMYFFEPYSSNNRYKGRGLVQWVRDGAPAYDGRFKDFDENLIYGSDEGATKEEMGVIPVNQWYRLTINWTPSSASPDNPIEQVTLTRLSDGSNVFSVKNVPIMSDTWPLPDIVSFNMGLQIWGGYPAQQIYFDNISIKALAPIEDLKLISPDAADEVEADSKLTLEFNKEVDADSLDGIFATSENFADPVIASASVNAADSKKVDVAFEYPLVSGGSYTLVPAGVKDADGNACTTDSVSFKVKNTAPANALVNEDFASLSNFTYDSSVSNVNEDGKWMLKIAPSAANNQNNGTAGDRAFVSTNIPLDEAGLMFETDYYPIGTGISDAIFYLKENQSPWGTARNGLVNVNVSSKGTPKFYKLPDGNTVDNSATPLLEGTAGHSYNVKYHLSKRDGVTYGRAYIRDNITGELTVSDEIAMANVTYKVINEIGFAQRSWGAAESKYSNLFVYPATKPQYAGCDVEGEILEDYSDLSFDVKFSKVLDKNSIENIKVMAGSAEIASAKTLTDDSKTVRVDVTGSLPELSTITVVLDGVADTDYQTLQNESFTFQTASALKVTDCSFDKESIKAGDTINANVSFTNNASQPKGVAVVIAVYEKDADGVYTMKNVSANTTASVASGNSGVPVGVSVPDTIDASKALVKVMVLDNMTNMMPLCNDFTLGK